MQVASLKAYEDTIHHLATPNDRSDQPRARLQMPAEPAPSATHERPEPDPDDLETSDATRAARCEE